MPDLVLRNVGRGVREYLQARFGLASRSVGDDIIVAEGDANAFFPPRNLIQRRPQHALEPERFAQLATTLANEVTWQAPPAEGVRLVVPGNLGMSTLAVEATERIAVVPANQVPNELAARVLPLLKNDLGASHVTSVTVDVQQVQAHLSLARILALTGRFGLARAEEMITAGRANHATDPFRGIVPHALDTLAFVEALTRFPPTVLTLPVRRINCAWHFQAEAMWRFHRVICNGTLAEFTHTLDPLGTSANMLGPGLSRMGEENVWRYLSFVVSGISNLFGWLLDLRNFVQQDGSVDFDRQLQCISGFHLLFADLIAMEASTSAHNRISFATSALDKLANLRFELGHGGRGNESTAFRMLCSASQGEYLAEAIRQGCVRRGYDELGATLSDSVLRSYNQVHEHLRDQGGATEPDRLARLWSMRNARHGSFLNRNQFEMLFQTASGTMPSSIASLHILYYVRATLRPSCLFGLRSRYRAIGDG